jgi:hypothetical protein
MRFLLVGGLAGLLFPFGSLHAQSQPAAQIVGRVLDADLHAPIAGARVTLLARTSAGTRSRAPLTTMSDASGNFLFAAVTPGLHVVSARKVGYVFDPQIAPLEAIAGQTVSTDIFLKLGGVVTGRIVDEHGNPVSGIRVMVASNRMLVRGDRAVFAGLQGSITDGIGEFRIAGLAEGEYLVMAAPQPQSAFTSGGREGTNSWTPTYYPGTANRAEAQSITVRTADTVSGLEFRIQSAPAIRVSGTVVDEAGQLVSDAMITVRLRPAEAQHRFRPATFVRANPDGSFVIVGLAAGVYDLSAVRAVRSASSSATFVATLDLTVEGAEQQVTVEGSDITGLQLVVQSRR